jgi:hypothetical protein
MPIKENTSMRMVFIDFVSSKLQIFGERIKLHRKDAAIPSAICTYLPTLRYIPKLPSSTISIK